MGIGCILYYLCSPFCPQPPPSLSIILRIRKCSIVSIKPNSNCYIILTSNYNMHIYQLKWWKQTCLNLVDSPKEQEMYSMKKVSLKNSEGIHPFTNVPLPMYLQTSPSLMLCKFPPVSSDKQSSVLE